MKRLCVFITVLVQCLLLTACGSNANHTLKIYVDGAAYGDATTMAEAFAETYPNVQVEVETLPSVRLDYGENYMPIIDTDSQAEREAALQQHRTALMAGSSDADLYLVMGGSSQYHEMNGGALVQDPYDLMTNGVLADMSALLSEIDRAQYLPGVLEAGQVEGAQYLIPLRVALSGVIVDRADGVEFPLDQEAFLQLMASAYVGELAESGLGGALALDAISYPVVNKATKTISLYDENYTAAIASAKQFQALIQQQPPESRTYAEQIAQGTLILAGTNPFLGASAIASSLMAMGGAGELGYIPIPNENNGVTVEATAYAFVPATSNHQESAAEFIKWLLSKQPQDGTVPVYSPLSGGYPVLKGCAYDIFQNTASYSGSLDYVGEGFVQSLAEFENRVTSATFTTQYDFELLRLIKSWQNGAVADLDAALRELYDDWALYLDE